MKATRRTMQEIYSFKHVFLPVCFIVLFLGILLEVLNFVSDEKKYGDNCLMRPKYSVYMGKGSEYKNDNLEHLHSVLESIGYYKDTIYAQWILMWSRYDIFYSLKPSLAKLEPYQKANQLPGTACMTRKVYFTLNTKSKYIPKAFKLPAQTAIFKKYAQEHNDSLFLVKHNSHRGIKMMNVSDINIVNIDSKTDFIQEYVQRPFLVHGHKFDIGVYVVITSVDPLRAYWYNGDVGFRYCPTKYYPFDSANLNKYVVADNYMPTWEVPTLADYYASHGHGLKNSFDMYVQSKGKDPSLIWEEVQSAIAETLILNARILVQKMKSYASQYNFFEMIRFDLIIDEDFKVYLIEANMAPNLNSYFHKEHGLLFEQVIYNVLSLTGIVHIVNANYAKERSAFDEMVFSDKHITVLGERCRMLCRKQCTILEFCKLCIHCIPDALKNSLQKAHIEYMHKGDFRRLVPQSMIPNHEINELPKALENMSSADRLQHMWYQEKCNQDITWCA